MSVGGWHTTVRVHTCTVLYSVCVKNTVFCVDSGDSPTCVYIVELAGQRQGQ